MHRSSCSRIKKRSATRPASRSRRWPSMCCWATRRSRCGRSATAIRRRCAPRRRVTCSGWVRASTSIFPATRCSPAACTSKTSTATPPFSPSTVYAHVVQQADHPDLLAVQYWLYWYYNDWNNKHESDWEFIQILFPASSVDEALEVEPISVGYAQHTGGEGQTGTPTSSNARARTPSSTRRHAHTRVTSALRCTWDVAAPKASAATSPTVPRPAWTPRSCCCRTPSTIRPTRSPGSHSTAVGVSGMRIRTTVPQDRPARRAGRRRSTGRTICATVRSSFPRVTHKRRR